MSKYTKKRSKVSLKERSDATENFEGGLAFETSAKLSLYNKVCTSLMGENKFYTSGKEHDKSIIADIKTVASEDPEFVLKLAAYVRNEMYLRSAPVVLLVEAANLKPCKPFVHNWGKNIIKRADELVEVMSYQINRFGNRKIPNCLKKALVSSFVNFDEYQFEKYNKDAAVTFRDIIRMVHPKPGDEHRSQLYKYLVTGESKGLKKLKVINAKHAFNKLTKFDDKALKLMKDGHLTWEVAISKFGNKKEIWNALNLPFMAGLRNLRNLLQSGADVKPVLEMLENEKAVARSRQLPFRFYSAFKQIEEVGERGASDVLGALDTALNLSTKNVPKFEGRTFVTVDLSGSMSSRLNDRSSMSYRDIASLFGAVVAKSNKDVILSGFGQRHKAITFSNKIDLMGLVDKVNRTDVGHATNAYLAVEYLLDRKIKVDRIVVFSDMQCWDSYGGWGWGGSPTKTLAEMVEKYRRTVNPNVYVYSVDLAGYGTAQFPENYPKTAFLAGWSDRIFNFMQLFEQDKRQAIQAIDSYLCQ